MCGSFSRPLAKSSIILNIWFVNIFLYVTVLIPNYYFTHVQKHLMPLVLREPQGGNTNIPQSSKWDAGQLLITNLILIPNSFWQLAWELQRYCMPSINFADHTQYLEPWVLVSKTEFHVTSLYAYVSCFQLFSLYLDHVSDDRHYFSVSPTSEEPGWFYVDSSMGISWGI